MTLPEDYSIPEDLDYERYIQESYNILRDIGYYNRQIIGYYDREEAPAPSPWEAALCLAIQQTVEQ